MRFVRGLQADDGQASVILALLMGSMLLGVGVAMDAGKLFVERRSAQAAADAGAWAGAVQLYRERTAAEARDAAFADVARNGFTSTGTTTVEVNIPPTTGPRAGDRSYVEVVITEQVATNFMPGSAAGGLTTVRVRGVAGTSPLGTSFAILALSPDGAQSLRVDGQSALTATGAGIMVNSSSQAAAMLIGGGSVVAPSTNVVGNVVETGQARFEPRAVTGASAAPDPFKLLPPPSLEGLPVFTNTRVTGNEILRPGIYINGITVNANGRARFTSGTYVIKGGGISVSGNGSMVGQSSDAGVLFFNTHDNYPGTFGTCGDIALSGNGSLDLNAAQTGMYAGMLVYQDRRCTNEVTISGNGSLTSITGTIYAPTADVVFNGNGSGASFNSQIIGESVTWNGSGGLTINYDPARVGRPRVPALTE